MSVIGKPKSSREPDFGGLLELSGSFSQGSSSVQQLILAAAQCLLAALLVIGGAACPEQSGSGQPQLQL